MTRRSKFHPRRAAILAVTAVVCLSGCGSDEDGSVGVSAGDPAVAADAGDDAGADDQLPVGDTSNLVVPLDYLQGEWCNTDGEAWSIDGETARFGANHDELAGELPVTIAFTGGSGVLISQTDDEFVLDVGAREVTFTRGRC